MLSTRLSAQRLALLLVVCLFSLSGFAAEVNLLIFGDWGSGGSPEQTAVAKQAAAYARTNNIKFDAALLLGDNFYKKMDGGVKDPRWQTEFEKMFDPEILAMPFYAALGNHDYEDQKSQTQLEYSRLHPDGRWKMPAKWYRVNLPEKDPIVTVLVLDSNYAKLSDEEWKTETAWFEQQLQRKDNAAWTIATAHHPLFTSGQHGDTKKIIADWGPLLKKHGLDFFMCGHDHDLQHIEMPGWSTTFLLAGGGGAKIRPMKRNDRGPFTRSLNGFLHLKITTETATGTFVTKDGEIPHQFTRSATGKIEVLSTTGRDKPKVDKEGEK